MLTVPKRKTKPTDNGRVSKSKPEDGTSGYHLDKSKSETEHPDSIEGLVLCRSGLKYYPIQGTSTTHEKETYSSVSKWTPSYIFFIQFLIESNINIIKPHCIIIHQKIILLSRMT